MIDVSAAGVRPVSLDAQIPLRTLAAAIPKPDDSVGPLLRLLAEPGIQHLLEGVSPIDTSRIAALVAEATIAIQHRDLPHAVRVLSQLVEVHPESAEQLVREPAFAEVRNAVLGMVEHATVNARTHAEVTLAAANAVATGEPDQQVVLSVANRFYEAGRYANYVRAAALGHAVIRHYDKRPAVEFVGVVETLWERAPLLVLLGLWFCVGLIGGVVSWISGANGSWAFDVWAIGFLALVGFQFYANVRKST